MAVSVKELLGSGYFLEELPPPFNSISFAAKVERITQAWATLVNNVESQSTGRPKPTPHTLLKRRFRESRASTFSVPKYGLSRRNLSLPNPFHQQILATEIVDNWNKIELILAKSKLSRSKPSSYPNSERALVRQKPYGAFLEDCILLSYDKRFELSTDISRFYPTLYTHVIPWATEGKQTAKLSPRDDTLLGNRLDKSVRDGNSRQTLGIPIGPDTSLVLAEIVLCALDAILQQRIPRAESFIVRHMDDYRIYTRTRGEAEELLRKLQGLLLDFELQINDAKTNIREVPYAVVEDWTVSLGSFNFLERRDLPVVSQKGVQRRLLKDYMSKVLSLSAEHPGKWVCRYAIEQMRTIPLFEENWDIFSALLFKIAISDSTVLDKLSNILATHRKKVNKKRLAGFIDTILKENIVQGHNYEVVWGLWLCKEFGITLKIDIAKTIADNGHPLECLVLLDLKSSGLINGDLDISKIQNLATSESLMQEGWILTYEATNKNWLQTGRRHVNNTNEYFKILRRLGVSFYDENRRLVPDLLPVPAADINKMLQTMQGSI